MADAFSDAFSFLKALQPSPHHMDAGMPEDQMRHFANMERMKQRFGKPPLNPPPQPPMSAAPFPRTGFPPRTLPPNPAQVPPVTRGAMTQRSPREIGMPMHPTVAPRPLSEDNPYGRIRESELHRLADDFGIPFTKAWTMLKALPEQQMFRERTRRETLSGADDEDFAQENLPEIDRFGARSYGTVHPAILGMLQRRTADYYENLGIDPNLNLDAGAEEERRMSSEHGIFRNMPGRDERQGMTIAQGPLYNQRMYDRYGGGEFRTPFHDLSHVPMSEEDFHNPEKAARGGPFDQSRYASGHTKPERFMTGYGYSPRHHLSHPKMGEYD